MQARSHFYKVLRGCLNIVTCVESPSCLTAHRGGLGRALHTCVGGCELLEEAFLLTPSRHRMPQHTRLHRAERALPLGHLSADAASVHTRLHFSEVCRLELHADLCLNRKESTPWYPGQGKWGGREAQRTGCSTPEGQCQFGPAFFFFKSWATYPFFQLLKSEMG